MLIVRLSVSGFFLEWTKYSFLGLGCSKFFPSGVINTSPKIISVYYVLVYHSVILDVYSFCVVFVSPNG